MTSEEGRSQRLVRALGRLEGLASTRLGTLTLFVLALAIYALRALAWPLRGGRDLDEYLLAYVQLFDRDVLLPWSLLFRTPVTPLVGGGLLDVAGGALAEPIMAALFAGSVVAWSAVARYYSAYAALAVAGLLLAYPGYGAMFHELSSEPVFAAAFAGWALLTTRAAFAPTTARFVLAGLGLAALALVRPGNAVLLVFVLFPFVLRAPLGSRLVWTAACAAAALVPLVAWSVHNGVRFGEYSLARGGNAIVPFYRAFITDHIVAPENGDDSRRLAEAMERHLLTREPYRSYGVTLDQLFRRGSFRVHEDLYLLSDQVFGWDNDYAVLCGAGLEGVRAHPGTYAGGVLTTIWNELAAKAFFRVVVGSSSATGQPAPAPTISRGGKTLPRPTEGEPIPAGQVVWISRPDQSIRQVWTSPTTWRLEFQNPGDRRRFEQIERETDSLFEALPDRDGNAQLGLRLNQLSRWFPRPLMWIALGLIAIAYRRPRGSAVLLILAAAGLIVVAFNALGLFMDLHFMLPVAPAFVVFGVAGLLGMRAVAGAPR